LQDCFGISAQHPGNDFRSIAEDRPGKHIAIAAHCPIVKIIRSKHDTIDPGKSNCCRTHWTRLKRNVHCARVQSPIV